MTFHFEADLDYQLQAVDAVCDLFRGQELSRADFAVSRRSSAGAQQALGIVENDLGVGNRLSISDDALLANLRDVQTRNALSPAVLLESGDFTVEMETGTGKTYVYLRTIFELNKRFGFTKFVIVVPSVAIKEGVHATLRMTEAHFKQLYAGIASRYFAYDSAKLVEVRTFATSSMVQIMVVTIGAINKKNVNKLYEKTEKLNDERAIDLLRSTHPIVIVDEPQSVDGGLDGAGKTALEAMAPLCTLRYSATHANEHHMVYRLDAVDAYERELVKEIEVAAEDTVGAHSKAYIRLIAVESTRTDISARIAIDIKGHAGVSRTDIVVHDGDGLEARADREIYRGFFIGTLRGGAAPSLELLTPEGIQYLEPGQARGDVDVLAVQRERIRKTIAEHFEKQLNLRPRGIKVLSLFFVDAVAQYRKYDAQGDQISGPYATIFEEEFRRVAGDARYRTLIELVGRPAEEVHDGYFSVDKVGKKERMIDTDERTQAGAAIAAKAYDLIMKKKETLVRFETPLAFIFSHSALKEGWDNPNVFQICTLRDIHGERERRQTIGRGLRLCVDQNGTRVRGFDVNTLTVIAAEPYKDFAEGLQKEIEEATGVRFGIVARHQFAALTVVRADGTVVPLGTEHSAEIWEHLRVAGYIDAAGHVQDSLRAALRDGTLSVPQSARDQAGAIAAVLRKVVSRVEVRDAKDKRRVKPQHAVLQSEAFLALWNRIKYKTAYRVSFDNERLVEECIRRLQTVEVRPAHLQWRKAALAIGKSGVKAVERASPLSKTLNEAVSNLPDILTELEERTKLTRRTLQRILVGSGRLDAFKMNPQAFIELAAAEITQCQRAAVLDGIRYEVLGDDHYYSEDQLDEETLGDMRRMIADQEHKSAYDHIIYGSTIEADFVNRLELESAVKRFIKLPRWFTVPTPLGSHNPDWAIVVEGEEARRYYFVVETKGSTAGEDLRGAESAKIKCMERHFKALRVMEPAAAYVVATTVQDVMDRVQ